MNTMLLILIGVLALVAITSALFATSPNLKDAALKLTRALPNGAATVYASPGIDTGVSGSLGTHTGSVEYLLTAPALNTTQCPDGKTVKYSILVDTVDPVDSSSTVKLPDVITQTGAGGAGAAAATFRFRAASDWPRIIGFKVVGSASGDATGASATLEVVA